MSPVKELLRHTIELLSEEEAQQLLAFVQDLQKRSIVSWTLRGLASDPAFHVPSGGLGTFRMVTPVQGKGVAASELLVEDRR